jgi:hypothetical protein
MKELIKPNVNEDKLNEVTELCEVDCNQTSCNKHCIGTGTVNQSISEENDIIF